MELKERLLAKHGELDPSAEGFSISLEKLIDYVILVYSKDDDFLEMQLNQKKEAALVKLKIKRDDDTERLLFNKSVIVSKLVTDMLHITANREFELYVSALEASTILLEVVRRPIDDTLDDEKWLNALKAKKQGFNDAKELLESASTIAEKMLGVKETDLEEHTEEVVFKEGISERLAKLNQKKKK